MATSITEVGVIDLIRRHILFAGYTYSEAASAIGLSQSTIYRRFNGTRAFELAEILALAALCEIDPRLFFVRDGIRVSS